MCEMCSNTGIERCHAEVIDGQISLWFNSARISKTANNRFRYCPVCGRPLGEAKALTLAEAQEREGLPVWADRNKQWGIVGQAKSGGKYTGHYFVNFAHGWGWLDELIEFHPIYDRPPTRQEGGESDG